METIAFATGLAFGVFVGNTVGARFIKRLSWKDSLTIGVLAAVFTWLGVVIVFQS